MSKKIVKRVPKADPVPEVCVPTQILKDILLFQALSAHDLKDLSRDIRARAFPKNTPVFYEGEHGDFMYIIKSGLVKIYHTVGDGRTKTLALLGKGNYFGEMALLTDIGRSASAATVTACEFLILNKVNLIQMLKKNPSVSFKIIQTLCSRLGQADRQIKALALGNARAKIADQILFLAEQFGEKDVIHIHLVHQDIADLAGASRETVTKLLSEFKEDGAISFNSKEIRILDREKLRRWTL